MIKNRQAIVHSEIGVTRDRHYGRSFWNGVEFTLIDTGGYLEGNDDIFQKEIDKQVLLAIDEADIILFMVDILDGLTGVDQSISKLIRKSEKPVLLVANKADNSKQAKNIVDFYSLGFQKIFPLSAVNGSGTGELLDELINKMPSRVYDEKKDLPKFAIVGGPNVGKSSFVNKILGEDRYIVTKQAGTTRDSLNTHYNSFGFDFILVDTAGIRKKSKIKENVEFYSVIRSIKSIERSDVCILMIDATKGFNGQDQNIFWLAHRNGKGIIILINKWDLIKDKKDSKIEILDKISKSLSQFRGASTVFISSKNGHGIDELMKEVLQIYDLSFIEISTNKLNSFLDKVTSTHTHPTDNGREVRFKYITQINSNPIYFAIFTNKPKAVLDSYKRYILNNLREEFSLSGVPIKIIYKKTDNPYKKN